MIFRWITFYCCLNLFCYERSWVNSIQLIYLNGIVPKGISSCLMWMDWWRLWFGSCFFLFFKIQNMLEGSMVQYGFNVQFLWFENFFIISCSTISIRFFRIYFVTVKSSAQKSDRFIDSLILSSTQLSSRKRSWISIPTPFPSVIR